MGSCRYLRKTLSLAGSSVVPVLTTVARINQYARVYRAISEQTGTRSPTYVVKVVRDEVRDLIFIKLKHQTDFTSTAPAPVRQEHS